MTENASTSDGTAPHKDEELKTAHGSSGEYVNHTGGEKKQVKKLRAKDHGDGRSCSSGGGRMVCWWRFG